MSKWHFSCFATFKLCELTLPKMHAKLKLCTQTMKSIMGWNHTPFMTFPRDHTSFPNPISGCCCKSRKNFLQIWLWEIGLAQAFKMHARAIQMMNSCKLHLWSCSILDDSSSYLFKYSNIVLILKLEFFQNGSLMFWHSLQPMD